jgi:hypothetical protein
MPMMFFYFLKIIFDISTSKQSKKYKPHSILAKKKKNKKFKFERNAITNAITNVLFHCTEETRRNQTPVFIISIKEKTHALITAQFVNILQDGGVRFILFSALKTKESERKRLQHMLEARTSRSWGRCPS